MPMKSAVVMKPRHKTTEDNVLEKTAGAPPVTLRAPGFEHVARVLGLAFEQTASGKGQQRHGGNKPFRQQRIMTIARETGLGGLVFQSCKKAQEAQRMAGRDQFAAAKQEQLGAIIYLVAQYLLTEELEVRYPEDSAGEEL